MTKKVLLKERKAVDTETMIRTRMKTKSMILKKVETPNRRDKYKRPSKLGKCSTSQKPKRVLNKNLLKNIKNYEHKETLFGEKMKRNQM